MLFFLQFAVILSVCRVAGVLARQIGQPEAVGPMIAGIVLGPSFLGAVIPEAQAWLFSPELRQAFHVVAQLGLAMYMFLVGVEFQTDLFRKHARAAIAIATSGMVVPFTVGVVIAAWLIGSP